MKSSHEPPKKYRQFIERFPKLGAAWETLQEAEKEGPLDEHMRRLAKLAVAIGSLKEGAVHSSVRKASSAGVTQKEMEQVVILAASIVGLPSTVAVYTWIQDALDKETRKD